MSALDKCTPDGSCKWQVLENTEGGTEGSLMSALDMCTPDVSCIWQVLENTEGGTEGSLMTALDMCATVMGKRRLRAWLCRPMARIAHIAERQDAIADLMGPAAQAAQAARDALSGGRTFLCDELVSCFDNSSLRP